MLANEKSIFSPLNRFGGGTVRLIPKTCQSFCLFDHSNLFFLVD